MVFWGMLGFCGTKLASRRLKRQNDRFAAFFGPLQAPCWWPLCKACCDSGGGGAGNLPSLQCWVGVHREGPVSMVFWGILGIWGSKRALKWMKGQKQRFAAYPGLHGGFFCGPCARPARVVVWAAQAIFPPSGAGLGCLMRGLFRWFSGLCWVFVGQRWHQGV